MSLNVVAIRNTGRVGDCSRKTQNSQFAHNATTIQYKYNCQNDTTTPNLLKTHKKTQRNARMGSKIPNLKNANFQKLGFLPAKIGGRALTPILNS